MVIPTGTVPSRQGSCGSGKVFSKVIILSPLLFCMALNPLSVELRRTDYDYWMSTGRGKTAKRQLVSHLLHVDDLTAVRQKS